MFLLIFNPSNDLALAADAQMYVPPRNVRQMEKDLELFPLAWAEDGDAVLGEEDGLGIEGKRDSIDFSQYVPKPWGWSKSLNGLAMFLWGRTCDSASVFRICIFRKDKG